MARREVVLTDDGWYYKNGDKAPSEATIYRDPANSFPAGYTFWAEGPDDPKPAPKVKSSTLYTLTVNGVEIEAEEKVWRALRAQLVDLFGVYDPSTSREER